MKVLFLPFNRNCFHYPITQIKGGIESVEKSQLEALTELGYDVTIAMSTDGTCTGFPTVQLPIESFETCGQYKQTKVLDFISESGIYKDYDVILSNRCWKVNIHHKRMELIKEWAPKLRLINHEPPLYLAGQGIANAVATQKWFTANGAKTATVMPDGLEIWQELEDKIRSGKMFFKRKEEHGALLDSVPSEAFNSFYEVMVVPEDARPINEITDGSNILFVARPHKIKGLKIAAQGAEKAGMIDRFIGYTTAPSGDSEQKDWDSLGSLQERYKVEQSHAEIMKALCGASVFLQPTASESAGGIVAFEAAVHGVPVITTSTTPRRYLEPFGLYHYTEERSIKSVAEALKTFKPVNKVEAAKKVREAFGREQYARNLREFLEA